MSVSIRINALLVARLTEDSTIPSILDKAASTWETHAAHVMPFIGILTCLFD